MKIIPGDPLHTLKARKHLKHILSLISIAKTSKTSLDGSVAFKFMNRFTQHLGCKRDRIFGISNSGFQATTGSF